MLAHAGGKSSRCSLFLYSPSKLHGGQSAVLFSACRYYWTMRKDTEVTWFEPEKRLGGNGAGRKEYRQEEKQMKGSSVKGCLVDIAG